MLLTPHILAGAAIITIVQNPVLGLIFVLLSHYCLDFFPQTEYSIKNIRAMQWSKSLPDFLKVFFDIVLGLMIVFFLAGSSLLILAAVAVALFPDILTLLHCIFPANKLLKQHLKIHAAINAIFENKKLPALWGIVSQIIVSGIAILLLR